MPPINVEEIFTKAPEELSDEEKRWLQDHGKLPAGVEHVAVDFAVEGSEHRVTNDPMALLAASQGVASEALEAEIQRRVALEVASAQASADALAAIPNTGTVPTVGGGAVTMNAPLPADVNVSEYASWKVDELRGELIERNEARVAANQPTLDEGDGKKATLISVLEADDAATVDANTEQS